MESIPVRHIDWVLDPEIGMIVGRFEDIDPSGNPDHRATRCYSVALEVLATDVVRINHEVPIGPLPPEQPADLEPPLVVSDALSGVTVWETDGGALAPEVDDPEIVAPAPAETAG